MKSDFFKKDILFYLVKEILLYLSLLALTMNLSFSQVYYQDVYYQDVYYQDIYYQDIYYQDVYYQDVYYEPISFSGSVINEVYYGGIDLRNYKITKHTITGKETASTFFNESVPNEYKVNWKKVIGKYAIGTTVIVITGVVALSTGGTVGYIAAGAFAGALKGGISGGAIGALIEGSLAALQGKAKEDVFKQAIEGSADGFMWGAITGAVAGGYKSVKELKKGVPILNSFGKIEYVVDKNGIVYFARGSKPVGTVFNVTDKNGKYLFFIKDKCLYNFDGKLLTKNINLNALDKYGIISDTTTGEIVGYIDKKGVLCVGDDIEKALKKDWKCILKEPHTEGGYAGVELGKPGSGPILKKNYQRYFNKILPKGAQAHHIVPSNGGGDRGEACRKILKKFGIDINDPHNCCPLSSNKNVAKTLNTMCHNGSTKELHGDKIMQSLYEDLSKCTSKQQVFEVLADYRQAMLTNVPLW